MSTITDLARHWMRQTQVGKGIRLEACDLDLLNALGIGEMLRMHAADDGSDPVVPMGCGHCDPLIYFMQAESGGPVKIGLTKNPSARRIEHQTSSPSTFKFLCVFRAPASFEKELHTRFRAERVRGEWFHPTARILRFAARMGTR